MPTEPCCKQAANSESRRSVRRLLGAAGVLALVAGLGACAVPEPHATAPPAATVPAPPPVAAAPAPVPVLPFDEAVLAAANTLFAKAAADGADVPRTLLIDPLVDGMTGVQSAATQLIQTRLGNLAQERYPQFAVQPFTGENLARSPLVLVGTFTPVNKEGKTAGVREAYRICLVLVDLKTGKTVAKGTARAQMDGVDTTPTLHFQDSPAWTVDQQTQSYINTCQATKVGDAINPTYLDGLMASALIAEAIDAYNTGRYAAALDLYTSALRTPAGDQLRAYNGLYLTNVKLGRMDVAEDAFGKIVDFGLRNKRLAMKMLFKPGSTAFMPDVQISGPYDLWLRQIAHRAMDRNACLEVAGHTSRTGPPALNERLSLLRAEYVRSRLGSEEPPLTGRTIANGLGAAENLVGTGADDATDALDRRVEFKVISAC